MTHPRDRDVYGGDDHLSESRGDDQSGRSFIYRIVADADPDVLLRTASQLLLANRAPYRVAMSPSKGDSVIIDAELRDISELVAESIRRKLRQLTCVASVHMRSGRMPEIQWSWPSSLYP